MPSKDKTLNHRTQCNAVVKSGLRCRNSSSSDSKWCPKHEEDQAKYLKTYKRFSADLNQFDNEIGNSKRIQECDSINTLKTWQENARKKWTIAKRAKDARIKHHRSFYYGGDPGHGAYISYLEKVQIEIESIINELDHRAYHLLVSPETSKWLMEQVDNNDGARCGDNSNDEDDCDDDDDDDDDDVNSKVDFDNVDDTHHEVQERREDDSEDDELQSSDSSSLPRTPPLMPTAILFNKKDLEKDTRSTGYIETLDDLSRLSYSSNNIVNIGNNNSDLDNTCFREALSTVPSKQSILVDWLRDYVQHGQEITNIENRNIRLGMMSNIFRVAISRTPSLLAAATQAGSDISVSEFVLDGKYLSTDDLHLLWKRLKYARGGRSSKSGKRHGRGACGIVTPEVIRNAIIDVGRSPSLTSCDDYNGNSTKKCHHYLKILGGYIWKKPLERPMNNNEWDHFYQFITCSGCSLSVTRSLSEWVGNRKLCLLGSRYPAWSNSSEHETESKLRILGGVISSCGEQKTKLERVKPKSKGLKTVLVERNWRSWVFMRMACTESTNAEFIGNVIKCLSEDFTVISRKPAHLRSENELSSNDDNDDETSHLIGSARKPSTNKYWVSRVRTGYTPVERRTALWTIESSFRKQDVLDRFAETSSFETRFSRKFLDGWDIVVMDNEFYEPYDSFLTRMLKACSRAKGASELLDEFPLPENSGLNNNSAESDWFHDQFIVHQTSNLFINSKSQYI